MFTGIVEAVGEIKGLKGTDNGISLQISIPYIFDDIKIGDSIAVNGACLTVKTINNGRRTFGTRGNLARRSG